MLSEGMAPAPQQTIEGFPLSPQQRRLWKVRRSGDGSAFRAACAVEVVGPLDVSGLVRALRRVVARHEALRTSFHSLPGLELPLQVIEDGERALSFRRSEPPAGDPFQEPGAPAPADGVVLEAVLSPLGPDRHLLRLSLPSLCCDGEGLGVIVHDLAEACAEGTDREVVQYVDAAQALNELLESEEAEASLDYWEKHGLAEPMPDPIPRRASSGGGTLEFRPRSLRILLPSDLAASIDALARRLGSSPKLLLLAAWQILLFRRTCHPPISGVAFDGRSYEGLDSTVGLLARYLPLRIEAAEEMPFPEFLRQVGRMVHSHEERQELFAWRGRVADGASFLPFCFEYEERRSVRGGGLSFRPLRQWVCFDRFDLRLSAARDEGSLLLELSWDDLRFAREDVELLAEHLEILLRSAIETPSVAIGDLEMLSDRQRRRLLVELNDTAAPRPEACLGDLFVEQAARTPHAIAALDERTALTYRDLAERSGRLADHLRRLGIGPEQKVGVYVERSVDLLVALLGVLRAGAAYVPLDPSYPADRLSYMLADSVVPVVITQDRLREALPPYRGEVLDLDDPVVRESRSAPELPASPDNLAYVLYTSGSTGRPKGVMISHRAILNRLLWMQGRYPLTAEDRVLQKTPASFDASVWELFCPLLAGATVVLARPDGHQDPAYLARAVAEHGITVLQLVPSLLRPFLTEPGVAACRTLRRLFCGGEALPSDLQPQVAERLPGVRLVNLYGPTEASIDATSWDCDELVEAPVVPIGRPLDNVRVFLVDRRLRPVPPGVAGELLIGGTGLSRGYLRLPALTAERFVPDPFGGEAGRAGERLFHTCDVVRYRADGAIEFLGRSDHQVKIRGVRIELGEIEARLRLYPGIDECVVAVREDRLGQPQLAAWIVPSPGTDAPPAAALREHLSHSLPELMVPAVFAAIPALPRLPNGKVDRAALPEPQAEVATPAHREPSGPIEELLAGIWCEVLKLERVAAEDDFFELGGHSLLATQLLSRLRAAFTIEMPMRRLFDAPRLSDLAAVVEAALKAASGGPGEGIEPPIERVPREAPPPASFAQERLFFLDRLQPGGHAYNLPFAARLTGHLDLPAVAAAFDEIRRRHESLRTTFDLRGGAPVQLIAPAAPVPLPLVDLSGLPSPRREEVCLDLVALEARLPFDLGRGPLLRVIVLRLDQREHVLLGATHHIVSDAWSSGLMVREFTAFYEAFTARRPPALAELPLQYADFALWQRSWLRGDVIAAQLGYWKRQLAGAPPVLELPLDMPRPEVQSFRGGNESRLVGPELTAALQALARREGVTLYMVLLAAWKVLLHHLSRQTDLVVGTSIANRNRQGVEGIIGFFINMLALRTGLGGAPDFREILRRVRETALGAYAHQDLPFAALVEDLRLGRDLSRNPIFQIVFTFENAPAEPLALPDLVVAPVRTAVDTALFDLALVMWETGEGLLASLRYSADLFRPATIVRWLDRLGELLSLVATRPEARLGEICAFLAEADQRSLDERERELEEAGAQKLRRVRRQGIKPSNPQDLP